MALLRALGFGVLGPRGGGLGLGALLAEGWMGIFTGFESVQ